MVAIITEMVIKARRRRGWLDAVAGMSVTGGRPGGRSAGRYSPPGSQASAASTKSGSAANAARMMTGTSRW